MDKRRKPKGLQYCSFPSDVMCICGSFSSLLQSGVQIPKKSRKDHISFVLTKTTTAKNNKQEQQQYELQAKIMKPSSTSGSSSSSSSPNTNNSSLILPSSASLVGNNNFNLGIMGFTTSTSTSSKQTSMQSRQQIEEQRKQNLVSILDEVLDILNDSEDDLGLSLTTTSFLPQTSSSTSRRYYKKQ